MIAKTCCCTLVVILCVVVQGAEKATVPQQTGKNWTQMSPYALVDSLYCPGQKKNRRKALPPDGSQPWMKMATKDFLPFIDEYGQFRWRDWPGKTKCDEDLKRAAEEEAKDLAANPGPTDWNKYGGWTKGPQLKATGRFRTEKIDGKWWLVDPEGRLFWSFGVMRVSASCAMTPLNGDIGATRTGRVIPDRDCFFEWLPPEPGRAVSPLTAVSDPFTKFWTTRDELLWPFYEARGETRVFDFSSANLYRKYGEDYYAKFVDLSHRRLRSWCVNTISSSSDKRICSARRTPYCDRVERLSRFIEGSRGHWWKFRDPWDPSFRTSVLEALAKRDGQGHDPMCLGFSIDNEVNWGNSPSQLAQWTLRSPADQPAKAALVDFMKKRYGEIANLNTAWKTSYADWDDLLRTVKLPGGAAKKDLVAFTAVIVEEYFKRTRAAVKEYDPQLLYLGCRFCTTAPSWVIGPCAKYSDVVTYNIYSPGVKNLRLPEGVADKPILITEFHFGAPDRGPFGASNWPTASQKERAESLQAYVRSALANPQIVGAHWHQFSDEATTGRFDGEYFQVGWTDICDRPYPETIKAVRESGARMYETRFSAAAVAVVTQGAEKWPETPPPTGKSVTWERLNKLDPGLKEIGRLAVCEAKDLKSSAWSIGCETLDRDYADWDAMKQNIGPLGAKHGRLFSGWAKTEKKKGIYDFAWLDRPVREMAAMGVKPWICLSYGNPIYGSDFRLNMKVREVTGNPEAFAAWLRYCTACVERYKDVVDEWEVWNEPFGQGKDYAEMFYRTARAIRAVQPNAKIYCTAVSLPNDYKCILERLKKENALDLASYFIYHPYDPNPDITHAKYVQPLRKLVKSYSGAFDIMQGESGCPSQLEYAHAMPDIEWTEYSQAKWAVRRAVGDAARAIPSGYFSLVDNNYGTMLQSFGLVRCNGQKRTVYRRPSYYALRNVFCFLTSEAHPVSVADRDVWFEMVQRFDPRDTSTRKMSAARFTRYGSTIRFFWFSDSRPSDTLGFDRATVWMRPEGLSHPVWVEMITGRVFEIPEKDIRREKDRLLITVPMWDSPVMIAPRGAVPLHYDWRKTPPYTIIDSIYRPGQPGNWMKALPPDGTAPWMKMKTEDFLPCFDKYGQFRWRDWPGKTKSDADLARAAEEEAKDLAANPGPKTWDKYGGWAAGPQLEATGRFRTEKVNGKWWFVDPEGRLFWSFGVMRASASCGMTPMNGDTGKPHRGIPIADRDCLFTDLPPPPGARNATPFSKFWTTHDELLMPYYESRNETRIYDLSSANLYRKYGGADYYDKFADIVHRRMRSWCMNTLSSSSDIPICLMDRTPYVERIERKSRPIEGSYGEWFKFPDPWDPTFRTGIHKELDKRKAQAKDPWCIGFFVDNEVNWGDSPQQLAEWTLRSPADQPAKKALVAFMRKKYGDIAKLNAAWGARYVDWDDLLHSTFLPGQKASGDLAAFTCEIEESYFRGVRAALKEYDPKILYLGCRFGGFGGSRRESVRAACARHCDVVSYNFYSESPKGLEKVLAGCDRPVLIPEFHFGANDRGPFGTGVCAAKDTAEKAEKAKRYVRDALSVPQLVGCHWHQFSDEATSGRFDGEYISVGLTDICDTPYPEMVKALREVGGNLYETRYEMTTSAIPKTTTIIPAPQEMRVTGGRTVCGMGAEEPTGYVPVMLSNGSLCMTADFLGGVPSDETARKRKRDITRGIFIVGKRFGGPGFRSPHGIQVEAFNFGRFALKVSVDGKRCGTPDRWSQTFDPLVARSITTNVFGNVTRVAETFVAPDEDTVVVRQTFPGTDLARIDAGLNYIINNSERFYGKWTTLPDGHAFDYTALGLSTYKGRITVRHAREDGAFVTFISFGKPYKGTYAAASARHSAVWGKYYAASEVNVPDADIMRMRRVAEYQLKCCTTKWSIPPGIPPSHWSAGIFAFDEMYAVQGLLSAGHFDEARRASDYRFRTLKTATARTRNTGARWVWISMETNPDDCAKNGFWLDHIFHMSAVARSCRLVASYMDDDEYLRAKAYPVIRECARFFRNHCIYDMPDGSSFVCKCTDLERLKSGRERPFMTTCGAIDTLRTAADAAERLGVDAKDASDWRATAERLLKSLPVKDGRFVPAADRPDAVSMGSLAGYFPFPIFPKGHKEQTAAVDFFLAQGVKAGNMYEMGKKICPWYAATMAMAALRAGEGEKVLPLIREASASAGVWGEYWEINEPGVAECRPWFMTAAGNCLYAINSMLLMEADGECRIGAGVPKEWKDWSFRLPAESGYEVDFAMKGGVVTKLVLRQQTYNKRGADPRSIKVVLPDGARRTVAVQSAREAKTRGRFAGTLNRAWASRAEPDAETVAQALAYRKALVRRPDWNYPIATAVVEVCGNESYNWFDLPAAHR